MKKNKHLLLWSSLGVLVLLVIAAVQENFLKDWRRIQRESLRTWPQGTSGDDGPDSGPVDVHLRQIVVPGLKATDRCVSCHVGMAPGEQVGLGLGVRGLGLGIQAGNPRPSPLAPNLQHQPVVHDPADYGCTVCHGGQGSATEKADAHGDVRFWPEPMIPLRFAYAGCASCHVYPAIPAQELLAHGRNLVERYDCLACHRLDGRGGTLRPAGTGGMEGPDLSRVGTTGWKSDWYESHLRQIAPSRASDDPSRASDGPVQPWSDSFGPLDSADLDAINRYLGTRVGAPKLVEAKSLFHSLGCRGCHKVDGVGGDDGPDLTHVGEKDPGRLDFTHVPGEPTLANWFAQHLRAPSKVVAGSQMPVMGLTEDQIELLTLYMLSLRRGDHPGAYWPKDRVRAERLGHREFATDPTTLYATFCAACHGPQGEGLRYAGLPPFPAIASPDFLAIASDAFIEATIREGRPGRRMPAWGDAASGLRTEEIAAVVAQLRRMGQVPEPVADPRPPRWAKADVAEGGRLYAAHCAGCHEPKDDPSRASDGPAGDAGEGPALHNQTLLTHATDTYLSETIRRGRAGTSMSGFQEASPVHPALTPAEIESIVSFIRTWEQP